MEMLRAAGGEHGNALVVVRRLIRAGPAAL
jgi:hypothetical protein